MTRRIPYPVLEARVREPLERRGIRPEDSRITGRVLLEAEARGYPAQGVRRVAEICGFLDRGLLTPGGPVQIEQRAPAVRRFHCQGCLGHPVAVAAVDAAVELARCQGLGCAAVLGAGHIGYLTHYAERAAEEGVLILIATTSSPAVALPGATAALLGTNPLAFAFPYGDGLFCADFATAEVARGEVLAHLESGTRFDHPVGVDENGAPTDDPERILAGGILPMGGNLKGGLVNLLLGVLAGPLVGGPPNHEVVGTRWPDARPNKTDFFLAFDLAAFGDRAAFEAKMLGFLAALTGAAPGFHVPGQHSRARWEEVLRDGFPETPDVSRLLAADL